MSGLSPDATARFTGRAADYERHRPSYPAPAIDAIFAGLGDPGELTIVDAGAGTGISTRLLVERGAHVVALEPNDEMRAAAAASGCDTHNGRAEATGLPDAFYDIVTAFQAFHWFGNERTLAEFKRLLRPGGRLALVWNIRDDDDAFTRGYGEIFDVEREREIARTFAFEWGGVLELLERTGWHEPRCLTFPYVQHLDHEGVLGRARSASYVPLQGEKRETILGRLSDWYHAFAGPDGCVDLHYRTNVYLAQR